MRRRGEGREEGRTSGVHTYSVCPLKSDTAHLQLQSSSIAKFQTNVDLALWTRPYLHKGILLFTGVVVAGGL